MIVALEDDPGADRRDRRVRLRGPPGLRRLPHAPAVRRLARGGVRAEGHRRAVRGDLAARRRDRLVGAGASAAASDEEVLAQARRDPRRDARPRDDDVRGQDRLRALARGRAAGGPPGPRAGRRPRDRAVRARGPGRVRRRELDGRGRRRWPPRRTSMRSTSTSSRSPSATRTSSGSARSPGARACRCARTWSSSTPTARCRWRWPPARARSTTSPACTPTTSRRSPPPSAPPCCCPARSSSAPRRPRPAARWPTPGAICVLATDCNPGTSPIASLPLIIGLAVRRYGWIGARGARRVHAQRRVGARLDDRGSIEVGKRADLVLLDGAGRARPVPLRPQPGGGGASTA